MMIRKDNFFTDVECDQIVKEVEAQTNNYVKSAGRIITLGNSFFNAVVRGNYTPQASIEEYRNNINDFTGFWNNLLLERMSSLLNYPTQYSKHWSLPGFNIIDIADGSPTIWHYDSEKTIFPYEDEFPDYNGQLNTYFESVITFTVMLVDGDTTFDYFPETESSWCDRNHATDEFVNIPCQGHQHLIGDNCPNPECTLKEYKTEHYKKGTLLLQDRRILHRKGRSIYKDHSRISMQGHGVVKDGVLWLHW